MVGCSSRVVQKIGLFYPKYRNVSEFDVQLKQCRANFFRVIFFQFFAAHLKFLYPQISRSYVNYVLTFVFLYNGIFWRRIKILHKKITQVRRGALFARHWVKTSNFHHLNYWIEDFISLGYPRILNFIKTSYHNNQSRLILIICRSWHRIFIFQENWKNRKLKIFVRRQKKSFRKILFFTNKWFKHVVTMLIHEVNISN